ncbi:MAG: hypothetical protein J0J05_14665 [Microbacterium sp.]|uniref:hypothetical protein n=1 Tax=Microbacterium sp. TaxID=51671 RepID=UPI001ACDE1D3|nr:hypothetical protein [Microbacterium sp.]MBN9155219.1 hypothetical protein [Microbacterium sp.]
MSTSPDLTPREHDDMRDLVVAGAARMDHRRRIRRQVTAAALAVVLVGGVIGGVATVSALSNRGFSAATPTPTSSATSTTTPTPTPTSGATPTATPTSVPPVAPDPNNPATWSVSDDAFGPIGLGTAAADVKSVLPTAQHPCPGGYLDGDFSAVTIHVDSGESGVVRWVGVMAAPASAGKLTPLAAPHTASGIGLGSTEAQLRAAYPDLASAAPSRGGTVLMTGHMYFALNEGVVWELGIAASPDDIRPGACM